MASVYNEIASAPLAPSKPIVLANTGTTESSNTTGMPVRKFATLKCGKVRIRATWLGEASQTNAVGSTSYILEAGERIDWLVENATAFVYVEAEDGASAYQAFLWTSSP